MISFIISIIYFISQALIWIIILSALLSFIMDPYHVIRRTIDQIVEPLLRPIRKIVPYIGNFDISPLILIILIQVVSYLLRAILYSLN